MLAPPLSLVDTSFVFFFCPLFATLSVASRRQKLILEILYGKDGTWNALLEAASPQHSVASAWQGSNYHKECMGSHHDTAPVLVSDDHSLTQFHSRCGYLQFPKWHVCPVKQKIPGESDQLELSDLALGLKAAVATYAWRVWDSKEQWREQWHKSQEMICKVEVANLSIHMCCMPPSAYIKVVSYRHHHLGGVDIPRPSATEQLDSLQWPGGHGNERHASNVETWW